MTQRPPYEPWRETTGEFRWRLGVRPLDLSRWIEVDEHFEVELAQKAQIMAAHPSTAFCALEGTEDAAQEVLDELVSQKHQLMLKISLVLILELSLIHI